MRKFREQTDRYDKIIENYNLNIQHIVFQLQGVQPISKTKDKPTVKQIFPITDSYDSVLLVLNGKPMKNMRFSQIVSDKRASVYFLNKKRARQIYGKAGKNRALIITTKK